MKIFMPQIDSTKFGQIIIDRKKYRQVLIMGGVVEERDGVRLENLFGTSHKIGDWEIEKLFSNNPEAIIIGTGQDGMLDFDEQQFSQAKEKGIEVLSAPTPKAIKIYNEKVSAGQRVNALVHTTC